MFFSMMFLYAIYVKVVTTYLHNEGVVPMLIFDLVEKKHLKNPFIMKIATTQHCLVNTYI